ncbi:MAG: response regulator transcription factor [Gemmatimonadetes bacterium]|nr:response regulator transcription factor [Gemmatimonadota bacterium]
MRILLVEDDRRLAENVAAQLRAAGFAVDVVTGGRQALVEAAVFPYDVIVLDLQLPDLDGVEVCRALRARGAPARILMATARDGVEDRIAGLETGADDYLVKPYSTRELIARIRALLRRPAEPLPATLEVGGLALDTAAREARRGDRRIPLTAKEFAVLEYLMRNAGRVVTREQISDHAWDANYDPLSNVIDVYIARLRRKVDGPGEAPLIETVRGAGYRLAAPATGRVA